MSRINQQEGLISRRGKYKTELRNPGRLTKAQAQESQKIGGNISSRGFEDYLRLKALYWAILTIKIKVVRDSIPASRLSRTTSLGHCPAGRARPKSSARVNSAGRKHRGRRNVVAVSYRSNAFQ